MEIFFTLQEHLVYTIGESAAVGSAGVVLWGDSAYSKSKVQPNVNVLYSSWDHFTFSSV